MSLLNLVRIAQLCLPWFSILFLPRSSLNKYFPVAMFTAFLSGIYCYISYVNSGWTVKGGWKTRFLNDFSFTFGPMFVGDLWIFHFTYGKFKKYFLANLVIDGFFAYVLMPLFDKINLFRIGRFKSGYVLLHFMVMSVINYGFQHLLDRNK